MRIERSQVDSPLVLSDEWSPSVLGPPLAASRDELLVDEAATVRMEDPYFHVPSSSLTSFVRCAARSLRR